VYYLSEVVGLNLELVNSMRMKSKLKLTCLLISTLLTAALNQACTRSLDPEPPCGFVQSSELQRVSWKGSLPVRFMIHESVPVVAFDAVRAARDHWNKKMGAQVFSLEIFEVGGPNQPRQDDVNIIYWLDNWESDKGAEQARTTIYWTGSRIYEADIRVNAQFTFHFKDTRNELGEIDGVDLESLMIHEFGHALGLAHRAESQSVMQTTLASGTHRRELSKSDTESLKCEYGEKHFQL